MCSDLDPVVAPQRKPLKAIAAFGLALALVGGVTSPASARYISTGRSHGDGFQYSWGTTPRWTGVKGHAHAIQANRQVRVYGARWGTDPKTGWLTTLNRNYYSSKGYLTGNTPKMGQR